MGEAQIFHTGLIISIYQCQSVVQLPNSGLNRHSISSHGQSGLFRLRLIRQIGRKPTLALFD